MGVVVGASLMTLGHAAMAVETEFLSWYCGFGNGFFKPNDPIVI
jgi:POT family proton-dependent oligopeptide transporter